MRRRLQQVSKDLNVAFMLCSLSLLSVCRREHYARRIKRYITGLLMCEWPLVTV